MKKIKLNHPNFKPFSQLTNKKKSNKEKLLICNITCGDDIDSKERDLFAATVRKAKEKERIVADSSSFLTPNAQNF